MPLVRITVARGLSRERLAALSEGVHRALVTVANAPADDRFQVIEEVPPDNVVWTPSYLGIEHRAPLAFVQVFMNVGRTAEVSYRIHSGARDRGSPRGAGGAASGSRVQRRRGRRDLARARGGPAGRAQILVQLAVGQQEEQALAHGAGHAAARAHQHGGLQLLERIGGRGSTASGTHAPGSRASARPVNAVESFPSWPPARPHARTSSRATSP